MIAVGFCIALTSVRLDTPGALQLLPHLISMAGALAFQGINSCQVLTKSIDIAQQLFEWLQNLAQEQLNEFISCDLNGSRKIIVTDEQTLL